MHVVLHTSNHLYLTQQNESIEAPVLTDVQRKRMYIENFFHIKQLDNCRQVCKKVQTKLGGMLRLS